MRTALTLCVVVIKTLDISTHSPTASKIGVLGM
jgi:hypothetical protein